MKKKLNLSWLFLALLNLMTVIIAAPKINQFGFWSMFLYLFAGAMMCTAALTAGYVGFVKQTIK